MLWWWQKKNFFFIYTHILSSSSSSTNGRSGEVVAEEPEQTKLKYEKKSYFAKIKHINRMNQIQKKKKKKNDDTVFNVDHFSYVAILLLFPFLMWLWMLNGKSFCEYTNTLCMKETKTTTWVLIYALHAKNTQITHSDDDALYSYN